MKRIMLLVLAGLILLGVAYAYRPLTKRMERWRYDGDGLGNFHVFEPTPAEIEAAMGRSDPGAPEDPRRIQEFVRLYKSRFRSNFQAVSISHEAPGRFSVQFAAVIPRWDMANVTLDAAHLAHRVLGRRHDFDIYETYIPTKRKIGELRWPEGGERAKVIFDESFAEQSRPLGPEAPTTLGPFSEIPFRVPPAMRGTGNRAAALNAPQFLRSTDLVFEQN